MVKEYRTKVGQRIGGIKLYSELKTQMNTAEIKMGRDKFFTFLRNNNMLIHKLKNYHITTNSNHQFHKYNIRSVSEKNKRS